MKLNELKSALQSYTKFCGQIDDLQALRQKSSDALAQLVAGADLEDQNALDKIVRLGVQVDLVPSRITVLEEAQESSRTQLMTGVEEFVETTIRPKIKVVRALAVEKVTISLESIFTGQKLANAVNESDVVASLDQIGRGLNKENEPLSPIQYVTGRLAVLDQLAKIEKSLQT